MNAVLHHKEPEQVPVGMKSDIFSRGYFERMLRNKGVGIVEDGSGGRLFAPVWSEMPNVVCETRIRKGIETITYHTPFGCISYKRWSQMVYPRQYMPPVEWLFKDEADYDAIIYMIDDTVYHRNDKNYHDAIRDLDVDGIMIGGGDAGIEPPYETAYGYMGLEKWSIEQYKNPHDFNKLLKALEKSVERALPIIAKSPAEVIGCGSISGFYGLKQFKKYILPFYKRHLPFLHSKGKICLYHAHSLRLKCLKEILPQTGLDVLEAFTPPPVGDLSLTEARNAWGERIVIWVNIPESIFLLGREETKKYTLNLLKEGAQSFVFTELALFGVNDEVTNHIFQEGFWALVETILNHKSMAGVR
jgi:hypothetical protein